MDSKELVYYPIFDESREKAQMIKSKIQAGLLKDLHITENSQEANIYLVGWGDGFMLDTVKKYYEFHKSPEENKLFFWINCGTLWFLLNDFDDVSILPKTMEDITTIKADLIKVNILKKDGTEESKYAINDVVVGGNVLDYFKFDISSLQINKRFHGTGVIVSTPLGSSAYWLNAWYPIMPSGSNLRGIGGVASLPFGYNILRPEDIHIKIKGRSPVMVGVDGYAGQVNDIQELSVHPTSHYATIAFFKDSSFDTKRMLLAEQKLIREDF